MGNEIGEAAGGATKRCPFCAEEIQVAAILCKHCHSAVPAPKAAVAPVEPVRIETPASPAPASSGVGSVVTFGLVVVALLGGAFWTQSWYDRQKFLDAVAPLSKTDDLDVDLSAVIRDFDANEVAAKSKYADRLVRTSGTIQNIGALGSESYVIFDAGAGALGQCYTSQRQKVEALSKGSPIRVRARATSYIIYLQLQDCEIL